MTNGWRTESLGNLVTEIRYGLTAKGLNAGSHRLLRITDIAPNGSLHDGEGKFVEINDADAHRYLVSADDILVARSGATVGKAFLAEEAMKAVYASYLIRLRTRKEELLPAFCFFFLHSPAFKRFVAANRRGAAQPNVNSKILASCPIPLPTVVEQKRIVLRIRECMARVDEIRSTKSEASEIAHTLPQVVLGETFERLRKDHVCRPLKALATAMGGGTPSKKRADFWTGAIPWVSPKDMKSFEIEDAADHISEEAIQSSAAKLIPADSVLFVVRGMILIHTLPVAITTTKVAINQDMKALVPNEQCSARYLAYMLRGASRELLSKVEIAGHGTRRLQTQHWSDLEVPVPPIKEQSEIVAMLDDAMRSCEGAAAMIRPEDADALATAVLRKAFEGEL